MKARVRPYGTLLMDTSLKKNRSCCAKNAWHRVARVCSKPRAISRRYGRPGPKNPAAGGVFSEREIGRLCPASRMFGIPFFEVRTRCRAVPRTADGDRRDEDVRLPDLEERAAPKRPRPVSRKERGACRAPSKSVSGRNAIYCVALKGASSPKESTSIVVAAPYSPGTSEAGEQTPSSPFPETTRRE